MSKLILASLVLMLAWCGRDGMRGDEPSQELAELRVELSIYQQALFSCQAQQIKAQAQAQVKATARPPQSDKEKKQ